MPDFPFDEYLDTELVRNNDLLVMGKLVRERRLDASRRTSTGELIDILYRDCPDGGPMLADQMVRQSIVRIRRAMKQTFQISHIRHMG